MHRFWQLRDVWCRSPEICRTADLHQLLNDPGILRFSDNGEMSYDECREICSGKYLWFFIYSMTSDFIGIVSLLRSDGHSAEVCILLHEKWRGKGIGSQVIERLSCVAFLSFGLTHLYARVILGNTGAVSFFEKCGFTHCDSPPGYMMIPNRKESVWLEKTISMPEFTLSVIIPTHNCEKWIEECIASLGDIPCEIIVSDDASDDATADIVERMTERDARIRLLRSESRIYAGGARNTGLEASNGDYVFFLDGDDRLFDEKVLDTMRKTACIGGTDIICTCDTWFGDGEKNWLVRRGNSYSGIIDERLRPAMLSNQRPVWMCLFRRDFLMRNEIGFAQNVRSYEDNLFTFCCALTASGVITVPGALVFHRIRPDSLSHIPDVKVQTEFINVARQQFSFACGRNLLFPVRNEAVRFFFHSVFLTALYVWNMLGRQYNYVVTDSIQFLKDSFLCPDIEYVTSRMNTREKELFLLAWKDTDLFFARAGDADEVL